MDLAWWPALLAWSAELDSAVEEALVGEAKGTSRGGRRYSRGRRCSIWQWKKRSPVGPADLAWCPALLAWPTELDSVVEEEVSGEKCSDGRGGQWTTLWELAKPGSTKTLALRVSLSLAKGASVH